MTKAIAHRAAQHGPGAGSLVADLRIGFASSLLVSIGLAVVLATALHVWFGASPELAAYRDDLRVTVFILVAFVVLVGSGQIYVDLLAGLQRLWVVNVGRAFGALASIGLLYGLVPAYPSIAAAVFALLAGLALSIAMVIPAVPAPLRRPWPLPPWPEFCTGFTRLFREGWGFIFVQGASIAFLNLPPFFVAWVSGVEASVDFGIHARALVLIWSVTAIISNPVWPALRALSARGDKDEALRVIGRSSRMMAVMVLGAAVLFALFGDVLIRLWIGREITAYGLWRATFPAALVAILANQYLSNVLLGLGAVRRAAQTNAIFTGLSLTLGLAAAAFYAPAAFFGATAMVGLATVGVTAAFIRRALHA